MRSSEEKRRKEKTLKQRMHSEESKMKHGVPASELFSGLMGGGSACSRSAVPKLEGVSG